jgi:hypothetical protein
VKRSTAALGREQRRQRLSWQGDFCTAASRLGAQSDRLAMIQRTAAVAGWPGDLLPAFLSIIRKYHPQLDHVGLLPSRCHIENR